LEFEKHNNKGNHPTEKVKAGTSHDLQLSALTKFAKLIDSEAMHDSIKPPILKDENSGKKRLKESEFSTFDMSD
jgi:hypothetical protein